MNTRAVKRNLRSKAEVKRQKKRARRATGKMITYFWRWIYVRYVKVIIAAVITAIIEIIGELYVERRRRD